MALKDETAIGNGEEIALSPIEAGVKTYGVPEAAGAIECKGEEDSDHDNARSTDPALTGVGEVNGSEYNGEDDSGGPKANAIS